MAEYLVPAYSVAKDYCWLCTLWWLIAYLASIVEARQLSRCRQTGAYMSGIPINGDDSQGRVISYDALLSSGSMPTYFQ